MVNHLTVVCGEGVRTYSEYISKLVTHRSPFTKSSVGDAYKMCDFENVSVTTFRQLPIVWKYPTLNYFCAAISLFILVRTKSKFFRWSRELMLVGVGAKPMEV
jgi:hypothetical protein